MLQIYSLENYTCWPSFSSQESQSLHAPSSLRMLPKNFHPFTTGCLLFWIMIIWTNSKHGWILALGAANMKLYWNLLKEIWQRKNIYGWSFNRAVILLHLHVATRLQMQLDQSKIIRLILSCLWTSSKAQSPTFSKRPESRRIAILPKKLKRTPNHRQVKENVRKTTISSAKRKKIYNTILAKLLNKKDYMNIARVNAPSLRIITLLYKQVRSNI